MSKKQFSGKEKDMAVRGKKVDKSTLLRLISYFKQYKKRFFLVILCILISALSGGLSSIFLKTLIDSYITPLLLTNDPLSSALYGEFLKTLIVMGIIFASGIIATFINNRIMVTIAQGILKDIRDEMFSHMQKLPVKFFDVNSHGDIMSFFTNDTDTLRQMLTQSIPNLINSVLTVLIVFIIMLYVSVPMTVFVVMMLFFNLKIIKLVTSNSSKFFIRQQRTLGNLNGYIEEYINGQRVVQVFCHEEAVKKEFDKKNERLAYEATQANKFANILMPIMGNIGHLQYVLIAIFGGFLAIKTDIGITIGSIASFLQLSRNFNNPITQASQQLNAIIMALAGAKRIFSLIDEKIEEDGGTVTLVNAKETDGILEETNEPTGLWAWKTPSLDGGYTLTRLAGDVRMSGVSFGYDAETEVLHDINIYAKPGQKVAFVGATGAGKTTVTNLINRFYDIKKGVITYDGIDIKTIKKPALRHSLGVVLQDVNLFTGSVMDNIRYGRLDATDEDCIRASKLANADSFIRMLPYGYNTILKGNGTGLSQGQRQLISIARAAVANPPVMVLDEATSSIDTRTESIVSKGMDGLMNGRTVFVIAHRLSTVRNADVIMVLENGKIIERGDHEQLLRERGKYYKLYTGAVELE